MGLNKIKEIIVNFIIYDNGIIVMFLFLNGETLLVRNAK